MVEVVDGDVVVEVVLMFMRLCEIWNGLVLEFMEFIILCDVFKCWLVILYYLSG